jgi:SulP family sulfate permease
LYFIEAGQATAQLEYEDGRVVRLRTMKGGVIVGAVGLYLGIPASASVVADQPTTLYYLSVDRLDEMEEAEPQLAATFHRFVAQLLSERLVSATDTLQAVLQ